MIIVKAANIFTFLLPMTMAMFTLEKHLMVARMVMESTILNAMAKHLKGNGCLASPTGLGKKCTDVARRLKENGSLGSLMEVAIWSGVGVWMHARENVISSECHWVEGKLQSDDVRGGKHRCRSQPV
jgi:type II secretory pathway component PulJ